MSTARETNSVEPRPAQTDLEDFDEASWREFIGEERLGFSGAAFLLTLIVGFGAFCLGVVACVVSFGRF